jgi:hypothetical protein
MAIFLLSALPPRLPLTVLDTSGKHGNEVHIGSQLKVYFQCDTWACFFVLRY